MSLLVPLFVASYVLLQAFDIDLIKPASTQKDEVSTSEIKVSEKTDEIKNEVVVEILYHSRVEMFCFGDDFIDFIMCACVVAAMEFSWVWTASSLPLFCQRGKYPLESGMI